MKYSTQACFLKVSVSYILDNWKMNKKKWGGYERVGKELTAARKRWREKYESKREREEKTQIKWIVPFKILCCL